MSGLARVAIGRQKNALGIEYTTRFETLNAFSEGCVVGTVLEKDIGGDGHFVEIVFQNDIGTQTGFKLSGDSKSASGI